MSKTVTKILGPALLALACLVHSGCGGGDAVPAADPADNPSSGPGVEEAPPAGDPDGINEVPE